MREMESLLLRMLGVARQLLPLLSWTPLLLLFLRAAEGCQETAWSSGRPAPDLGSVSLASRDAANCVCCALCHQNPACASLSYNPSSGECQLYSSVAGYDTLTPDGNWKYFVMPGRSQHHQFCRQDSDCQADGDFCRGRVCTDLAAVTCRVIFEAFGAGGRYGGYISGMFGWLDDAPVQLACMMGSGYEGFTRLLRSPREFQFDRQTILDHNMELGQDVRPHSMLRLAEHIRQAGTDPTYLLKVYEPGSYYAYIHYEIPREEPVLSDVPRPGVGSIQTTSNMFSFSWTVTMPYLPASGQALFTVNADTGSEYKGVVAREDGDIVWSGWYLDTMFVYIKE